MFIGNSHIFEYLRKARESGRLSHALLFVGPRQVGKQTAARMFASEVLGVEPSRLGTHTDVSLVACILDEKTGKQKKHISVDQIRDVRSHLQMSSLLGGMKIAMIDEADTMTPEAANALLKTLEEPSGNTLLILTAESEHALPQTIISRCQVLRFGFVNFADLNSALIQNGIPEPVAKDLASMADGRPGRAFSFMEDRELFDSAKSESERFQKAYNGTIAERLQIAEEIVPKTATDKSHVVHEVFDRWESLLREELLLSLDIEGLVPESRTPAHVVQSLRILQESRHALKANVHPQLALEHFLLNL